MWENCVETEKNKNKMKKKSGEKLEMKKKSYFYNIKCSLFR